MLTAKRLREVLHYSPDTGAFTWKVSYARAQAGTVAGSVDAYGYTVIRVDTVLYKAHRLAWLYVHGAWPKRNIDHINRNRSDNRIANLRDVDQSVNTFNGKLRKNNSSGITGVTWDADRKAWKAAIRVQYRVIQLGRFKNKSDAVAARRSAENRLLQFARG